MKIKVNENLHSFDSLLKLLGEKYRTQNQNLEFINSKLTLFDISQKLNIPLDNLKSCYASGLRFLDVLIKVYQVLVKNEKEDFVTEKTEEEFEKYKDKLSYLPYIGIDEFSALWEKDRNLLIKLVRYSPIPDVKKKKLKDKKKTRKKRRKKV